MRAAVSGQVDFASAPTMQSKVSSACKRLGSQALILDLGDVDFMDSSGLRVILHLHEQLRSEGGMLVLVGASDAVKGILSLTGLERHLTVADDLEQASALIAEASGATGGTPRSEAHPDGRR